MLTWKRPQKHHHAKERIFPVLPVQKISKSVHGARRYLNFRKSYPFGKKTGFFSQKDRDGGYLFKIRVPRCITGFDTKSANRLKAPHIDQKTSRYHC